MSHVHGTGMDSSVYGGPKTDNRFAHFASMNGQAGPGLISSASPLNCTDDDAIDRNGTGGAAIYGFDLFVSPP